MYNWQMIAAGAGLFLLWRLLAALNGIRYDLTAINTNLISAAKACERAADDLDEMRPPSSADGYRAPAFRNNEPA